MRFDASVVGPVVCILVWNAALYLLNRLRETLGLLRVDDWYATDRATSTYRAEADVGTDAEMKKPSYANDFITTTETDATPSDSHRRESSRQRGDGITSGEDMLKSRPFLEIDPGSLRLGREFRLGATSAHRLYSATYKQFQTHKDMQAKAHRKIVQFAPLKTVQRLCTVKQFCVLNTGACPNNKVVLQAQRDTMLREMKILQSLHHPSLVKVWGVCTNVQSVDDTGVTIGLCICMDAYVCTLSEWFALGATTYKEAATTRITSTHPFLHILNLTPRARAWLEDKLVGDVACGMAALHDARPYPIYHGNLNSNEVYIRIDDDTPPSIHSIHAVVGGMSLATVGRPFITHCQGHLHRPPTVSTLLTTRELENLHCCDVQDFGLLLQQLLVCDEEETLPMGIRCVLRQGLHFSAVMCPSFHDIVHTLRPYTSLGVLGCFHTPTRNKSLHTLDLLSECHALITHVSSTNLTLHLTGSVEDFTRILQETRGRIRLIHMAMHTVKVGGCQIQSPDEDIRIVFANRQLVSSERLLNLLIPHINTYKMDDTQQCSSPPTMTSTTTDLRGVDCIVLNTCYSLTIAQLLVDHGLSFAVAWEGLVEETASIRFADAFHASLAKQPTDYAHAFDCASDALIGCGYTLEPPQRDKTVIGGAIAAGVPKLLTRSPCT